MLLPLTLAMPVEQALAFMIVALLRDPPGRRHPGDPGAAFRARRRRGGDHARRLPDDAAGAAQQFALVLSLRGAPCSAASSPRSPRVALLPWLSEMGLYLRSVEMVVVMLFGLTLIAVIAAKDFAEGPHRGPLRAA